MKIKFLTNSAVRLAIVAALAVLNAGFIGCLGLIAVSPNAHAADFVVYSVYQGLDLGNPGETPQRDYYVNMGSANGLRSGTSIEVSRRIATYDVLNEKLYKDMTLPVGKMKVIHVEANSAICRLDRLASAAETPALSVRAVMVGDIVQPN